jgi:hypothetical protein
MKQINEKKDTMEGRKSVWGFLIMGIVVLLVGIFIHMPTEPLSLPKAEIVSGVVLIFGSIAALFITA